MKDAQGTNIINPETMKIVRNLRQKGVIEKQNRDYYINLMTESLGLKYGNGKSMMSLIEDHGQEWCINHGIIGYEYIVNVSLPTPRKTGTQDKKPPNNMGSLFDEESFGGN